jgi:hypothetical protein
LPAAHALTLAGLTRADPRRSRGEQMVRAVEAAATREEGTRFAEDMLGLGGA